MPKPKRPRPKYWIVIKDGRPVKFRNMVEGWQELKADPVKMLLWRVGAMPNRIITTWELATGPMDAENIYDHHNHFISKGEALAMISEAGMQMPYELRPVG